MTTLSDYRRRHAQYKTDASLQALHAACPWIVTWDDHETANDAWSGGAENHTTVATEFVVTSVTSDNLDDIAGAPPRTASVTVETAARTLNRHLKYAEMDSHGFAVLHVTAERTQCDWYYVADREDLDSSARAARSFATLAGSQRLRSVAKPV